MDLSTLVKMSNAYGSNPAYVLAGGGNTSVKDDTTLYVKGSGTQLATIKAEEFVEMSRARLNEIMKTDYPEDDVKRESLYLADVMAAVTDADKIVNGDISKQTPVPRQTSQPSQGGYDITNSTKITLDKAIEIVVNKAGVSENDLYSKNANYDYDHGQYIVEVEIDTKSTEYDAKIDAVSGNVLEWNSKNERVNSYINLNGVISLDKAIEIVVAEKNIDTNKILAKKASYDYERGKTVIGVEIYVDGFEYDVELDAMTGAVQKWN